MRQILFKAKRIDNGEWAEGGYVNKTDYYGIECDEHYIVDGTATDMEGYGEHYLVDKDTICQYTGLTDKNGKKIWENDIIQLEDRICHIYWFDKNAQFDCKFIKHNKDIVIANFKGVEPREYEDYEVIGNIFDNTEWLGEQNG